MIKITEFSSVSIARKGFEPSAIAYQDNVNIFIADQINGILKAKLVNNKLDSLEKVNTVPVFGKKIKLEGLAIKDNNLYVLSSKKKKTKEIYRINLSDMNLSLFLSFKCLSKKEKYEALAIDSDAKNFMIGQRRNKDKDIVSIVYRVPIKPASKIKLKSYPHVIVTDKINEAINGKVNVKENRKYGISSIELSRDKSRYLLLFSYEGEMLSGISASVDRKVFESFDIDRIIDNLMFHHYIENHKPEGITMIDSNKAIIVCDDDDVLSDKRKSSNISLYTIVTI